MRLSIVLDVIREHLLDLLDFAKGVIEAVFILEHYSVPDREQVSSTADTASSKLNFSIPWGIGDQACPVLTYGRTTITTAPAGDKGCHPILAKTAW